MNELHNIFSKLPFSHHAYGIESSEKLTEKLKQIIPQGEYSYIFDREYDSFKIDDARIIKSLQVEKTEKAAIFILEFTFINNEAQNTLLKVLEEPTPNTYFILVFPNTKKLLPTLQSRLSIISITNNNFNGDSDAQLNSEEFVNLSLEERFLLVKNLTDKKSKTKITKTEVLTFLNEIELCFSKNKSKNLKIFETIFRARNYLGAKGASVKMILEMLAIHI